MKGIKAHSHTEREEIVRKLIPIIKERLGNDFIALAAAGSYARGEDIDYSDLELVAFTTEPLKENWEIRKIVDGLYIVVIVDTKDSYIQKYLEVSDIWYASGADKLQPIINEKLITEINNFIPDDIDKKCLIQIQNRYHLFQEITAKTLNTLQLHNREGLPIIFNQMVKELLIILSYLNSIPYSTLGKYITQAKQFPLKPQGFDEIIDIVINGKYQDLENMNNLVMIMFSDLETILKKKGLRLYSDKL